MERDPTDYEWQQRQRIAKTDWAKVHIEGGRASRIVQFMTYPIRRVLGDGVRTERGGWRPEGRA